MDESTDPLPKDSSTDLILWFYLAPDGVITEKEILVYDLDDLLGNIGGSLGLFLGASILSMYDTLKSKLCLIKVQ